MSNIKYFCDQCSEEGRNPYHFSDGNGCNNCNHSITEFHVIPVVNLDKWDDVKKSSKIEDGRQITKGDA